jgi:hypothetical protein
MDDLVRATITSIRMAFMKMKAEGLFLHEAKSPWVVLQPDGAPPHWGLIVLQFLDATRFQNQGTGSDGPTPWTLTFWTF